MNWSKFGKVQIIGLLKEVVAARTQRRKTPWVVIRSALAGSSGVRLVSSSMHLGKVDRYTASACGCAIAAVNNITPRHPPCDRNDARLTARLVCNATEWRAFRRIGSASVRARYLNRRAPRLPKPPGPKHAADRGNGSRRLPHFLLMFQRSVETARLQARRWYAARAAHARTASFIRMSHSPKRTVA
ncbi:hypothetical protein [Burkholderia vietnamiensis]|uniref:hypothetical protein n=1 Tax=Burkholderia vietnamiensis TaxID=60552 RepID=UPI00158B779D|nr:hypothetical protein [Burkholderia vietnamiensis]MBH9647916.1 hypothetical protein [Burkholderia vietnamiensis]MBR7910155.1 hypothetical protein [Burkholderia vietnamiensis]MBR8231815.1 hypothetical protein [Burkholderia vietnamiensis]HDR9258701.1 hypothetical protein [Burkholderia vietnamiensis]HDR9277488.1 hypothetical protein [Burkholderia vietnamiensis]